MDHLCVIVDDLPEVWDEKSKNVVLITPYHYFDLKGKEERPTNDCDLFFLAYYLRAVCHDFYSSTESRSILVSSSALDG